MVDEWKSAESRERFMAIYRQLRAATWGDVVTDRNVETSAGRTRVFVQPGNGEPVVLLHGANTNAFMWANVLPYLPGLHVVMPDIPGEVGESDLSAPMGTPAEMVAWCVEVIDSIGARRVHLVGASYGGWIAAHLAATHTERVAALTLVEPVLDPLTMRRFMAHGIATGLAISIPGPQRKRLARVLGAGDVVDNVQLRKMGVMGFRFHTRKAVPRADAVADEVIAALPTSTTVLLGRRSSIHHADALAARIRRLNPAAAVEIIRDGHHTLPVTHATLIAERIRATSSP